MRKYLFITFLLVFFITSPLMAGIEYFAAPTPTGTGTACTTGNPCTVSYALNTKMTGGDDLTLKDGTYDAALDMIIPPATLDGTSGDHTVIKAENEGLAIIDGSVTGQPVYLNGNDYIDLENFNAHTAGAANEGRVIHLYNCNNINVKRVVGWDADESENAYVFFTACSVAGACGDILFEDCAGWGGGRKIFSSYKTDGAIFRRCFFRWSGQEIQNPYCMGLSSAYYSTNTIVENCIGTWDETGQSKTAGLNRYGIFSIDPTSAAGGYEILGNIAYHLAAQESGGNGVARHFAYGTNDLNAASALVITNNIAYTDRNDLSPFQSTKSTATISFLTAIGGTYATLDDAVQVDLQTGTANNIIQTDSNKDGIGVNGNDFDYVWQYNNVDDYDGDIPDHHTTGVDPDLIGNCGSILQYGCTANIPEVDGQDVGAKIQYRYVDGVLTGTELWPWPMDARIAAAMVTSGYDAHGGLDGEGATGLTDVIFKLGGGQGFGLYDVSPTDGGTGIAITASATWNYLAYIDSVDVYLDKCACDSGFEKTTLVSNDDADKIHDMSTLDIDSIYCLVLVPNDGEQAGADHEFEFTTTGGPPPDVSEQGDVKHSTSGGNVKFLLSGSDVK